METMCWALVADAGGGCRVQALQPKRKKEKMNMGVVESFQFLAKSPYIRDLALLVRSPVSARDHGFHSKDRLQQHNCPASPETSCFLRRPLSHQGPQLSLKKTVSSSITALPARRRADLYAAGSACLGE